MPVHKCGEAAGGAEEGAEGREEVEDAKRLSQGMFSPRGHWVALGFYHDTDSSDQVTDVI